MAVNKKTMVRKLAKPEGTDETLGFDAAGAFTAANDHFQTVFNAFSENAESMRAQTEDMIDAFRGNLETAQTRMKSIGADLAEAARTEAAEAVTFVNDLARAKTVVDAIEIQRSYWTNLFETRVERAREMTKTTVEAARESFEPFSKSFAAAPGLASFEKFFPFATK
jgi:hypothetical protein